MKTASERFWPKVDKNGPISNCRSDLGPCWITRKNHAGLLRQEKKEQLEGATQ